MHEGIALVRGLAVGVLILFTVLRVLTKQCVWQANKHKRGTAFGHAGIVASASAVLADLERGGILRVLLGGEEERENMEDEGGADNKGEAVGAVMQEKVDAKVRGSFCLFDLYLAPSAPPSIFSTLQRSYTVHDTLPLFPHFCQCTVVVVDDPRMCVWPRLAGVA